MIANSDELDSQGDVPQYCLYTQKNKSNKTVSIQHTEPILKKVIVSRVIYKCSNSLRGYLEKLFLVKDGDIVDGS